MKIFNSSNYWIGATILEKKGGRSEHRRIAFISVCRDGLCVYGGLNREYKNHSGEETHARTDTPK